MTAENVMAMGTKSVSSQLAKKITAPVNFDLIKNNKYDKFGDGDYISVETVTDLLNEAFGFVWSWEVLNFFHQKDDPANQYVVCHGRLTIPGVGVRDGIGQAKADKKDNSTMYSSAASFAFKSAAKRIGIAPNIFNKENWEKDAPVFEPGWVDSPQAPVSAHQEQQAAMEQVATAKAPEPQTQKKIPETPQERGAELKAAYKIATKGQFVAFAQIWNPNITDFSQITSDVINDLHAYVEENSVEFEDFVAADYQ